MESLEPENEKDRIIALAHRGILDSLPESGFDAIAQLAARVCDVPISLVSFVDAARQWAKASVGLPRGFETPRDDAFCARTILGTGLFEVSDAARDSRFADNPLVVAAPKIRFYAGFPLIDDGGHALGSLCVIDRVPRSLTEEQRTNLALLATTAVDLVEARTSMSRTERARVEALAAAVEFAAEPIVIHEAPASARSATITYVNAAFTTTFGYAAHEIVGQRIPVLYGPATDPDVTALLRAKVAANEAADASLALYDRGGTLHEIDLQARPVCSDGITTSYWIATLRDVTEERRNARELALAAERTRLLYTIASSQAKTARAQIDAALDVGMSNLGLTCGFAASVAGEVLTLASSVGSEPLGAVGATFALNGTRLEEPLAITDVIAYDDASGVPFATAAPGAITYRSFIVAPLTVAGKPYGLIGFAARERRGELFTAVDRDFVRLIAALIGAALERSAQRERLDFLAFYDTLTGLPNRSLFADRLERAIAASSRNAAPFALHFVDLDGLKAVNDNGGHGLGDSMLREAGLRMSAAVRDGDTVARIGGDEFVVLQLGAETRADAEGLADRLVSGMREPIATATEGYSLRASIGVARYPADGTTAERLLERADAALYAAKRAGKDRVAFAEDAPDERTPANL